jgi:hypothetical protein
VRWEGVAYTGGRNPLLDMSAHSPLHFAHRAIECRALALYRAAPEVVQPRLPEGRRPLLAHDHAIIVVCYTRLGAIHRRWLPRRVGSPSDHLSIRVATKHDGKKGHDGRRETEHDSWVLRRRTSSWIEARCGDKLFRGDYARAEFELEEGDDELRLEVRCRDREEFFLHAELAKSLQGSLFPHAREAEELLARTEATSPPDLLAPEADGLELHSGAFAVEPMTPLEIRTPFLENPALFPPGSVELDSVFRLTALRRVEAPQRSRASSSPIIDARGAAPA